MGNLVAIYLKAAHSLAEKLDISIDFDECGHLVQSLILKINNKCLRLDFYGPSASVLRY